MGDSAGRGSPLKPGLFSQKAAKISEKDAKSCKNVQAKSKSKNKPKRQQQTASRRNNRGKNGSNDATRSRHE